MPLSHHSDICQMIDQAWQRHKAELRHWLLSRLGNAADADDLLQDVFERAMRQGECFGDINNARAWLFRVARNALVDHLRLDRSHIALDDHIVAEEPEVDAIDTLSVCIPRVLSEMSDEDRQIITLCDLDGMTQQQFATLMNISVAAAKSRLQRARKRMRQQLECACQVRLNDAGNVCCFVPRPPLK
ncbi:sigma-70 family RNA polymerase sigma factor [Mariprofundus erugo]|uniref:Sigma-70 family RNA polymerase sigma factor n=1 Tax=Mariprofundus erugo TaxID=2528639 RepID=A0A5R9GSA1_9PROT|nr:sigma-70 family RNA polymerase sigma factor [Mariprofundus erugo]TLS66134.1 sigma-70 family RNA polymerase sigma factor [Mariprofundus erugo]